MSELRKHLRNVLKKEISAIRQRASTRGGAYAGEGRKSRKSRSRRSHRSRRGSAMVVEGGSRRSRRSRLSRRSHRSRSRGSALIGLSQRVLGGAKRVRKTKGHKRGSNKALLIINKIAKEQFDHLPRAQAIKQASAVYRGEKKGGSRRSKKSYRSRRSRSRSRGAALLRRSRSRTHSRKGSALHRRRSHKSRSRKSYRY